MNRLTPCLALAFLACGHARPDLTIEPLRAETHHEIPEIELTVAGQKLAFLVGTEGLPPSIPLEVAERGGLFVRDHSKLNATAATRSYFVDYYGNVHADLVAYSTWVTFPSGQSGKFDLQLISEGSFGGYGTIALQDLVKSGSAVTLDLARKEIRFAPENEAVKAFKADHPDAQPIEFKSCGRQRAVAVQIEGVKTWLELSTGSTSTFLNRYSPVVTKMANLKGRVGMVGGAMSGVPGLSLGQVPLKVAGREFPADLVVLPNVPKCIQNEGSLGMDVLKSCSFVWSDDEVWMSCHA